MILNLINIIAIVFSFLVALTIHEFSHALAADRLGDPNPRLSGRLSLNPLAHIDPIGTIILPLFLIFSGSPIVFGWAKPVNIDVFNFKNIRRDTALTSFAGPAANLVLAILFGIILRFIGFSLNYLNSFGSTVLLFMIINNLSLAIFNLIPIHPLDGGKILVGLLPRQFSYQVDQFLNQYGQFILLFLIFPFFGRSLISQIISPLIMFIFRLLIPGAPLA